MRIQLTSLLFFFCVVLKAQIPIPAPDHIVIVVDENRWYSNIIGYASAPYVNGLATGANGALFTQSFGITHPSQPNYINLFSGTNQGVTNDDDPKSVPFATTNLGASLLAKGETFTGFAEDMPYSGFTDSASGNYLRRHCPWIDWQGGTTNGIPATLSQPLTSFPSDFSQLPTVSFVIPNLQHDMHSPQGSRAAGDTWLKNNLDAYIQWAKTHNSLFILTYDEGDESLTPPEDNHIVTLFVGQMVKQGQYSETINHLNVLRTIEEMYGLPYAGNSANVTAITDCWKANQTITFNSLPSKAYGDPSFDLAATASSGLAVSYISSDPSIASMIGNTVTILKPGLVTITAQQAGDANSNLAPDVQQTLTITKGNQTISFSPLADKIFGDLPFSLSASASSGLAVSFSSQSNKVTLNGSNATIVAAGRETIIADQAGDQNYNVASSVNQSFCINPPKPTIEVTNANTATPTLTSSASTGNQWYYNGTAMSGKTNSTLIATKTGDYSVQITIDDCKSAFSENTSLVVTGEVSANESLSVFPNPANEFIFIKGASGQNKESTLFNTTGQLAKLEFVTDGDLLKADIRGLSSGVYVIRFYSNGLEQYLRFVKQ